MSKWVFEAKHVNAFAKPEEIQERYYPQLQHNIYVTGADGAYLSVIYGNHKWEVYQIPRDDGYITGLIGVERQFWRCVETGDEPVPVEPPKANVEAVRKVDMSDSNSWAEHANVWLANKGYAKAFETSVKEIKALIEEDVAEAFGHGIKASRSKSGAITIRESK